MKIYPASKELKSYGTLSQEAVQANRFSKENEA